MPEKPRQSIFIIELDALLDTRMGTLLRLDKTCVDRVIKSGYLIRDRDQFLGIDPDSFKELYNKRDKQTLSLSMMTPMMNIISEFCKSTISMNNSTPFIQEPKVVINIHPYSLTDKEAMLIKKAVEAKLGKLIEVDISNMKYEQITPSYLNKDISVLCLYDSYKWLDIQAEIGSFRKEICPLVTLYGPLLVKNLELKEVDLSEFNKSMELLTKPFIDFKLVPVSFYSFDMTRFKNNKDIKEDKQS